MVLVSLVIVLLCSTYSYGQQFTNTELNISGTEHDFGWDFKATLNLTCGPDTVISVVNVTTCPQEPVNCGRQPVICPTLKKGDIENVCGNKQNCPYNTSWRCQFIAYIHVTLKVEYKCSKANNETTSPEVTSTSYTTSYSTTSPTYTSTRNNNFTTTATTITTTSTTPTTTITTTSTTPTTIPAATTATQTPTITVISAATATMTTKTSISASTSATTSSDTGTTTREYVGTSGGNPTYPLDTTESGNRDTAIIIALSVVSALSLIAFLAVTIYVCCIRRRCHYCNPFKKQGQDEQLPGIALSRPPSVLNPYETTPVRWSKSFSTRAEFKASEESDHIYSEVDLEGDLDLDGPSEVYTTNQKTDIDSGYNELYTDIDLPVTVIHVTPEQEEPTAPRELIRTTRKDSCDDIFLDKLFSFLNDADGSENSNDGDEAVQASGNIDFDDAKPEVDSTFDSKMDQDIKEPGPKHDDSTPKSADVIHGKTKSSCSSDSEIVGKISAKSPDVVDPIQNGYFTLESVDEGLSAKSRMPEGDVPIVSKFSTNDDKPRRVSDPTKHGYFTLESVDDESNPKDSMLDTDIPLVSKRSPGEEGSNCDVVQSEQATPRTRKQITTANGSKPKPKYLNSIEDDDTEYNTLNLSEKPVKLKLFEGDMSPSASDYNTLSLSDPRSDVKEQKLVQKTADVVNTGYDTVKHDTSLHCTKETAIPATSDTMEGQYNKLNLCETNNASQPNEGNFKDNVLSSNRPEEDMEYNTLKLRETVTGIKEVVTGNLPLQHMPEQKVSCTDGTEEGFEYNKLNLSQTVTGNAEVVNCSQPTRSMSKEKVTCYEEREEASHYNKLNL